MMRPRALGAAVAVLLATASALADDPAPLPLTRVRLYESGVGYFERSGTMPGRSLSLPVPAAHLDDALKTLVVLSPGGTVSGLEFASSVSRDMAQALAGLPRSTVASDGASEPSRIGYGTLLESLKGASVELRTARERLKGRIVEVLSAANAEAEACEVPKPAPGAPPLDAAAATSTCVERKSASVILLGDDSEIRRIRTSDIVGVKPADEGFKTRLGSALDALGEGSAKTARDLEVLGEAGKPIAVGYVAETPVWRSTYRLVLANATPDGVLQGWALVHNDTDEDWKHVKVELVNGQPDSFLYPLAAPRYARRELVTPERALSTVPQLLDTTVDNLWSGEEGGLGLSGYGEGGGGYGEGIGLGSIGTIGHGAGVGMGLGESSLLQVGNLASIASAEGQEARALFLYALAAPVELRAHGSALLPFLHESVGVRRIAYFASAGQPARSAVHLKNDTQQTLPAGTIAVFGDGGFAGESGLSRTKPGEERIIQYGLDLDVELSQLGSNPSEDPRLFTADDGGIVEHFVRRTEEAYAVNNRSGAGRSVYLELAHGPNTDVKGADRLEYDEEHGRALAVFQVGAQGESIRQLDVEEGMSRPHRFANLTPATLRAFATAPRVPAEQATLLRRAADELASAAAKRDAANTAKDAMDEVEHDIARLRANAAALGDAGEDLLDRIVAAEDELTAERTNRKRLLADADALEARSRRTLGELAAPHP